VLAAPLGAEAQQGAKVYRIGILALFGSSPSPTWDAFLQGLRDLGYEDGRTITIDYLSADGRVERFPRSLVSAYGSERTSSS
jgi:hypothetical protein